METLDVIICKNTAESIVESLQKALEKGVGDNPIKDICLIDSSGEDIVILVSGNVIEKNVAEAFWLGYQSAIK
jgi:hypothetical protein